LRFVYEHKEYKVPKIHDINEYRIPPLRKRYPSLSREDIPERYSLIPIKSDEIEEFDVILFHRLMKKNYGDPPQIECKVGFEGVTECDIRKIAMTRIEGETYGWNLPSSAGFECEKVKTLQNGQIAAWRTDWRYFVTTESGGIIAIGTKGYHSSMFIGHVLSENQSEPDKTLMKEGEKFITDLLAEAKRLKGQIFNPKKQFEKGEGLLGYLLHNVYYNF